MIVDELAARWSAPAFRSKFKGVVSKVAAGSSDVVLLKPQTYMNRSGESVQPAMAFWNVPLDKLIVVHDELDLEFGVRRVKVDGGTAGHNGLRSIMQHCGGAAFIRVRIGIGRPKVGATERHVLSDFNKHERALLPNIFDWAVGAIETIIKDGPAVAMNRFHATPKE